MSGERTTEEYREKEPAIFKYVMGDMKIVSDMLAPKPWIVSFPIWILRSMGAPIFLNNPISGLLILIGKDLQVNCLYQLVKLVNLSIP